MKRKLKPHQQLVFDWSLNKRKIALFLEMRLGKTLITIRWLSYWGCTNVLIVCPKTVIPVWINELALDGYSSEKIKVLEGSMEKKKDLYREINYPLEKSIVIANYEAIRTFPEFLNLYWSAIVLDESTRVKNPKAEITKLLTRKTDHVRNKAILTGCPAPENQLDYFEQMHFLVGKFMLCDNYWKWREIYFNQYGFDFFLKKSIKDQFTKELAFNCYFLTRKEAKIEREKVFEKRYIEMNGTQKRMYREVVENFLTDYRNKEFSTKFIPVQIEWLSRIAGGFTPDGNEVICENKYTEILNLLSGELKDEKVVIWFKHNSELFNMTRLLKNKNYKVGFLTGENKSWIEVFQKGRIQILCAQTKCGMMGLDLSISSTAIYFSNWWSAEIRLQSEDRILNMNKKDSLLYLDLISKDTVDEDTYICLKEKILSYRLFAQQMKERMKNAFYKQGKKPNIQPKGAIK